MSVKRMIVAALLLAGCVDSQAAERAAYERIKGKPISDMVLIWGKPESEITKEQGTIYTFVGTSPVTFSSPATISCRINVYTNNQGRIQGLRHQGAQGACVDMYALAH